MIRWRPRPEPAQSRPARTHAAPLPQAPDAWRDPATDSPEEKQLVSIRVRGEVRYRYYRIGDRWYSLDDLDRWKMNTSERWPADLSWYLKTSQIEAWR